MAILVVGGAGYIGSHMTRTLLANGEDVVVLDNLRTGHREAVPAGARLYVGDIRDRREVSALLRDEDIESVMHFAALSLVGESMTQPLAYFDNNVGGMIALLQFMQERAIPRIVFSSSAAVYGEPDTVPIAENSRLAPTNPYGESKLIMEKMMHWAARAHGIRYASLRYFNVAGAWPDGTIGEDHCPESHLVPIVLQVPLGKRQKLTVYGNDYPTTDGTCIRDYISVTDLTDAHLRALNYLRAGGESLICNLGNGEGFSVLEILKAARETTGHDIPFEFGTRRPGDPAVLVASSSLAREALGWQPVHNIADIIASAWQWHGTHPDGYGQNS